MTTSYASNWLLLPGTEPRPVTPVQWPTPPRVQLHAILQSNAQLLVESSVELPVELPVELLAAQVNIQVPVASPMPTMSLPPEAQYDTFDALLRAAQLYAKPRGYAFTQRCSKKTSSGRKKVVLDCDRHGDQSQDIRRRERRTNTCATGCQFSITAYESSNKQYWELKHRLDVQHSIHNHPPSLHPSAHAVHQKLDKKDQMVA
jgi:hypothetical protein